MQRALFIADGAQGLIAGGIYTLLLLVGAVGDVRTRKIPNRLVAFLAVVGLVYAVIVTPSVPGAFWSLGGMGIGLCCWLPFYAIGWLGAGDVKLFAAAGAWLGPLRTVEGALIAAASGAVLALIWMIKSYGARDAATTLALAAARPSLLSSGNMTLEKRKTLPYGIALAFGAIVAGWAPGLLF